MLPASTKDYVIIHNGRAETIDEFAMNDSAVMLPWREDLLGTEEASPVFGLFTLWKLMCTIGDRKLIIGIVIKCLIMDNQSFWRSDQLISGSRCERFMPRVKLSARNLYREDAFSLTYSRIEVEWEMELVMFSLFVVNSMEQMISIEWWVQQSFRVHSFDQDKQRILNSVISENCQKDINIDPYPYGPYKVTLGWSIENFNLYQLFCTYINCN